MNLKEWTPDELSLLDQQARLQLIKMAPDSFRAFVRSLVIPSAHGPRLFHTVMADFQDECFRAIEPSLVAVKDKKIPPIKRVWIERTKKSSKDTDLACMVLWLMAFASRPLKIQISAANSEQASIIANRAAEILHYNSWLNEYVEIIQYYIRSKKKPRTIWAHIESTSSTKGAGEKQGEAPDVLILNELVHVERWVVMRAHMSNASGVPRCLVIVSTNAGVKGTEAEVWRKEAERSDRWKMLVWTGLAPWIDPKDVEEDRRRDPIGAQTARLWEGKWVDKVGGAVTAAALDDCFILPGPSDPEPSWQYLMALDMGETHDHSGAVVVGVHQEDQRIKVCRLKGWAPTELNDQGKKEVNERAVENWCWKMAKLYDVYSFGFDPAAGGRFIAQRLRRRGIPTAEMSFSSDANQTKMATAFVQAVNESILECYDDEEGRLRRDFSKFEIEHRPPNRYKLKAVSDEYGHADVGVALAICLPTALELMEGVSWLGKEDDLVVEDKELTEEDLEEMDPDLRELWEEFGEHNKRRYQWFEDY